MLRPGFFLWWRFERLERRGLRRLTSGLQRYEALLASAEFL